MFIKAQPSKQIDTKFAKKSVIHTLMPCNFPKNLVVSEFLPNGTHAVSVAVSRYTEYPVKIGLRSACIAEGKVWVFQS